VTYRESSSPVACWSWMSDSVRSTHALHALAGLAQGCADYFVRPPTSCSHSVLVVQPAEDRNGNDPAYVAADPLWAWNRNPLAGPLMGS
jgi:hypothetical protein